MSIEKKYTNLAVGYMFLRTQVKDEIKKINIWIRNVYFFNDIFVRTGRNLYL